MGSAPAGLEPVSSDAQHDAIYMLIADRHSIPVLCFAAHQLNHFIFPIHIFKGAASNFRLFANFKAFPIW